MKELTGVFLTIFAAACLIAMLFIGMYGRQEAIKTQCEAKGVAVMVFDEVWDCGIKEMVNQSK